MIRRLLVGTALLLLAIQVGRHTNPPARERGSARATTTGTPGAPTAPGGSPFRPWAP